MPRRSVGLCKLDFCDKAITTRGLCSSHFRRWYKARIEGKGSWSYLEADPVPLPFTAEEKLYNSVKRIDPVTGCWFGPKANMCSYGSIVLAGKRISMHRAMYEIVKGPIPEDLEIDHLCMTPACCNPNHLEAVTHEENIRRRTLSVLACKKGHTYTPETTFIRNGRRRCKLCTRELDRNRPNKKQRAAQHKQRQEKLRESKVKASGQ